MPTPYEIPLLPQAQRFNIVLGGNEYQLNVYWNNQNFTWVIDLYDSTGTNQILTVIPLVTGTDLFSQYAYLNLGGQLIAQTDGDIYTPPTYSNLGSTGHLYFIIP
jgi:hypothetical protein